MSIWIMPNAIKNIKIPHHPRGEGDLTEDTALTTQKDYKWEGILDNICTLDVNCNVGEIGTSVGCTSPPSPPPTSLAWAPSVGGGGSPSAILMSVCINLLVLYLNIFVRSLRFKSLVVASVRIDVFCLIFLSFCFTFGSVWSWTVTWNWNRWKLGVFILKFCSLWNLCHSKYLHQSKH